MPSIYPQWWMTYQGHTFLSIGFRHDPPTYRLVTNEGALAEQLCFSAVPEPEWGYRFEKWVPEEALERWVERRAYARYAGQDVPVRVESGDRVHLVTSHPLPGLFSSEPGLYEGSVPKAQLERFWTSDTVQEPGARRRR